MSTITKYLLPLSIGAVSWIGSSPSYAQPRTVSRAQNDVLPSDFRGTISYAGQHEGTLTRGRRTDRLGGSLNITIDYNGQRVTGSYSGTGGINHGTLTGSRTGSRCRLVDDRGGDVLEAECTRTRFVGISQQRSSRQSATVNITTEAVRAVGTAQVSQPAPRSMSPLPSPVGSGASDPLAAPLDFAVFCWLIAPEQGSGVSGEDAFGSLYIGGLRDEGSLNRRAQEVRMRVNQFSAQSSANRQLIQANRQRCQRHFPE